GRRRVVPRGDPRRHPARFQHRPLVPALRDGGRRLPRPPSLAFRLMPETYEGVATIEKVAALARRRAFVFPSSDIYGGLGSSYDYGHYGVLLKQNVKAEWQRSFVQERDDIVLLDSAIILHPQVWVASGPLAGFSDPMVGFRPGQVRFRAAGRSE